MFCLALQYLNHSILYQCLEEHTSSTTVAGLEQDQARWDIVARSDDWKSNWTVSTRYVKDDFVRVFLNVFGIIILLFVFDYFVLESLSIGIASTLDSEQGFVYDIVNAIMMALGKVLEVGIDIIFLMMLFMALEEEDTEINN